MKQFYNKGQSLVEVMLSIFLSVIFIAASTVVMGVALKNMTANKARNQAVSLYNQAAEIIASVGKNNWHGLYDLTKDSDYQLTRSGNNWSITSGQETDTVNNISYKRYFRVSNVNRDTSGNIVTSGGSDDPNTQKITIYVNYGYNYLNSISGFFYLTRSFNNKVFYQTDWSGGTDSGSPVPTPGNQYATSTNITVSTAGQISLTSTSSQGVLESSIFDTGVINGAGYNSLLWQGSLNGGTVKLQLASSNSDAGPWTYYGPTSQSDYYTPTPGFSTEIAKNGSASPQNKRFIRYKVFINTTSNSPVISDIIINWSP